EVGEDLGFSQWAMAPGPQLNQPDASCCSNQKSTASITKGDCTRAQNRADNLPTCLDNLVTFLQNSGEETSTLYSSFNSYTVLRRLIVDPLHLCLLPLQVSTLPRSLTCRVAKFTPAYIQISPIPELTR